MMTTQAKQTIDRMKRWFGESVGEEESPHDQSCWRARYAFAHCEAMEILDSFEASMRMNKERETMINDLDKEISRLRKRVSVLLGIVDAKTKQPTRKTKVRKKTSA